MLGINNIRFCCIIILSLLCFSTYSGPWLTSGEPWSSSANTMASKSDIDLLAAHGFISAPVLTWPIAWENIGPSLLSPRSKKQIKASPLYVQSVYFRVLSQYKNATQTSLKTAAFASGGGNINPFRTFEYQPRSDFNGGVQGEKQGENWAAKLAVSYGNYDDVTKNVHLDDSYLYGFLGNWALGVDKMSRWWSPAYSDSMILSANAPPLPTLTFQRMRAEAFQSKWLNWIGPWSFTTSLSVGGEDVPVPHPLIWLTNLSFRPLHSLQFGLSRVAFFAGSSRPLNLEMFKNLLIVNDNCTPEYHANSNYCENYSPGTEHWEATVDWNLSKIWNIPTNVYLQTIFNDRVPYNSAPWLYFAGDPLIPGRTAFLAGSSTWFPVSKGLIRLYAEFEYTFQYVYYFWGERATNIYGYSGYPYTYYGKLLGTPLGGEAEGYTIGGVLNEENGNSDTFLIRFLKLNEDNFSGGSAGYPFSRQNILWVSVGRAFELPNHLGKLSGQLAYLKPVNSTAQGLRSSPSGFLTWSKNF